MAGGIPDGTGVSAHLQCGIMGTAGLDTRSDRDHALRAWIEACKHALITTFARLCSGRPTTDRQIAKSTLLQISTCRLL